MADAKSFLLTLLGGDGMKRSGGKAARSERAADVRKHLDSVTLADVFDWRVLGLAFMFAWQLVVFFSPVIHYSTRNSLSHFNSVVGFSSLGMIFVLLLAAIQVKLFSRIMEHAAVRWMVPVVLTGCTITLAIVDIGTILQQPWCSIASTLAGAGLGVLYLAWGEVLHRMTIVQITVKVSVAFLLATICFAFMVMIPKSVSIVLTTVLPAGTSFILFKVLKRRQNEAVRKEPAFHEVAFSIRAVFSLGVLFTVGAFSRSFFLAAAPIAGSGSYPWLFLVAALISMLIVCGPLLSSALPDFAAAYKTSVFALGFAMLLLPLLEPGSIAASVVGLVTYCVSVLLVWIVLARIIGLYGLSPLFTFGIGWAACTAGLLVGTFSGALVLSFVPTTPRLLSAVVLVCVCLLFFAYLFLFTESTMGRLLGGGHLKRRPFHDRCRQLKAEFGLTDREEEIMLLIAKGRSAPRIREELGLTAGTVNAHVSHLYRKLDVHDRQELIDLVEQTH